MVAYLLVRRIRVSYCGLSVFMLILQDTEPIVEDTTGHSHHHGNNWTALLGPPFPPPHQTSDAMQDSEPTLVNPTTIPLPHNHGTTLRLSLPSDDAPSLLPDIDYLALTEVGTMTSWDGNEISNLAASALDTFENTFGSYEYPQ